MASKKVQNKRGRGRPSNADKQLHMVTFQRDEAVAFIRMLGAGSNGLQNAEEWLAERGYETAAEERERTASERAERRNEIQSRLNELQDELDQLG